MTVMQYTNRPAPAALPAGWALLGNEPAGFAIDFTAMSMAVRDRATAANNFSGDPNARLTYASPSAKLITDGHGNLVSGTTLRCDHDRGTLDDSATPMTSLHASKTLTIAGTATYAVGQDVRVTLASDITKWMLGQVTAWNAGTKALTISVYASSGFFTGSSWKVIVALGLLIERQSTNVAVRSSDLSHSAWGAWVPGGVTAKASIIPGATAYAFPGDGGSFRSRSQIVTLPDNAICCMWAVLEQDTSPQAMIALYNASASSFIGAITYTWATEAVATYLGTVVSSGVVNLGIGPNGGKLRLVWMTASTGAAGEVRRALVYPNSASGTGQCIVHLFQPEAILCPTSIIETIAATATRAGDVLSLPTSAVPYSATEGTLLIECNYNYSSNYYASGRVGLQLNAASNGERILLFNSGGTANSALIVSSNTTQAGVTGLPATSAMSKLALGFKQNDVAGSVNGGAVSADTSANMPSPATNFYIGRGSTDSVQLDGHIKRLKYLPRRVSDAELQAMAA